MEIWKSIKGYEGFYEVSDLGNVKRLGRVVRRSKNSTKYLKTKLLSGEKIRGYIRNTLIINGKQKHIFTHRLVALAFIINHENKPQVNHINGIKNDNRFENLEWCTSSENHIHAFIVLGKTGGCFETGGRGCKLKLVEVVEIKALIKIGVQNKVIAKDYNVNYATISDIKRGATWKNV